MHASEAFVNGAVNKDRRKSGGDVDLAMINTLLFGTSIDAAVEPVDGSADERQSEGERMQEPATKPGGFRNDPDDPSNPNEVRERHLKHVKQTNGA